MKHTPGPWYSLPFDTDVQNRLVACDDYGIATVYGTARGRSGGHQAATKAEGHANARLIASAPALLSALVGCRDVLAFRFPDGRFADVDNALAEARRAISAARGGNDETE